MGKGIALEFKRRYPEMFKDYVERCSRGEVRLGQPYVYRADDHIIINFPTKQHWRAVSRLEDIISGLNHLEKHYKDWGIESIAVPPLGCGNGQLEWSVVGPTLHRHLSRLSIPVELFAPSGATLVIDRTPSASNQPDDAPRSTIPPEWLVVVAILDRLERQPHHWPTGRVMFQKLVYFATQAGIPTGLEYKADSFGPYAAALKRMVAQLQNNGLAIEQQRGKMFEVRVGPAYRDAVANFRDQMEPWRAAVERTVDLMSRMNSTTAEVAASVHFVTASLRQRFDRKPSTTEVVRAVEKWKANRKPALNRELILDAVVVLALRGWVDVELDDEIEPLVEKLVVA